MTIEQMYDWFNLMQDKVDSVYYESSEIDQFINRAIQDFINKVIHKFIQNPQGELVVDSALEETLNISEVLKPLRVLNLDVTETSGVILYDDIESAIATRTGDDDALVLHTLSIVSPNGKPVRFVRDNDYSYLEQNVFKKAESDYPTFRVGDTGLYIDPAETGNYVISVIKSPIEVCYDQGISTDLPSTTHDFVLAKALQLAGIASKDGDLTQVNNAIG
jgi:hypothetical protein